MKSFFLIHQKAIVILILMFFCNPSIFAQDAKSDFWNQVRFGGGFGLNFGNGFFSATIAPIGVYEFNEKVALGVGLNGTFNSQKSVSKSTILGGSLIGLYNPIKAIQVSAEFEHLNVNTRYNVNLNIRDNNYWIPALYMGLGYRSGNAIFGIRYDVLYDDEQSIYADPWAPFVRFFF